MRATAAQVIEILQDRWANTDAHAWLTEVNNSTGYRGGRQFADAVVCSCWPSRGLWLAGIEVKVARSDWLRELRDPRKSAEIQQYCRYWWVAAPEGVVLPSEVPDAWGWLEVYPQKKRDRHKVRKQAPKLDEKTPGMDFLASVLRSYSKALDGARNRGYREALGEVTEKYERIEDLEKKLRAAERNAKFAERDLKYITEQVEEFQAATGLSLGSWRVNEAIKHVRAAQALDRARVDTAAIDRAVATLGAAVVDLKEALP